MQCSLEALLNWWNPLLTVWCPVALHRHPLPRKHLLVIVASPLVVSRLWGLASLGCGFFAGSLSMCVSRWLRNSGCGFGVSRFHLLIPPFPQRCGALTSPGEQYGARTWEESGIRNEVVGAKRGWAPYFNPCLCSYILYIE
jgi:hypothetical protein